MRTLFLFLLSCLSCLAQFGVEQPMFQLTSTSGAFDPSTLSGIKCWWVHTDLPTNGSGISTWTDRINGSNLVQVIGARQPTNSANGVRFTSHSLTNIAISTNRAIFLIFNSDSDTGGIQGVATEVTGASYGVFWNFPAGQMCYNSSAGSYSVPFASVKDNDVFFVITNTGPGAMWGYSNGFPVPYTNSGAFYNQARVGGKDDGTISFKGYIRELMLLNDATGYGPTVASNLHQYATNKYRYSP